MSASAAKSGATRSVSATRTLTSGSRRERSSARSTSVAAAATIAPAIAADVKQLLRRPSMLAARINWRCQGSQPAFDGARGGRDNGAAPRGPSSMIARTILLVEDLVRIECFALPPAAAVVELEDAEMQVRRVWRGISGGADVADDVPFRYRFAVVQSVGVAFEVRVVVLQPAGRIDLVDRVASKLAHEQLRDRAVGDGVNRRVARREDVHRLVRTAAAPFLDAALPGVDVAAVDRHA